VRDAKTCQKITVNIALASIKDVHFLK